MRVEWDRAKHEENRNKHGVGFDEAQELLGPRSELSCQHRGRRGAALTRREEGGYWWYPTDEQRSQRGWIGGRMQR